jgi:predicted dinucleotide-binding enzyme
MTATTKGFGWLKQAVMSLVLMGLLTAMLPATAETVAVIGTGRMGGAMGPRLAEQGFTVIYGSRDPAKESVTDLVAKTGNGASAASQSEAAQAADIIVLVVPWSATEEVVKGLGPLDGKLLIDVTNPMTMGEDGYLEMVVTDSGAELVQSWAPGSSVVKAFNVVSYLVVTNPEIAGGPVTIPVVGDDKAAKDRTRAIAAAMGFESEDLGPLRMARHVEGMVVLYMVPFLEGRMTETFEIYLRKNPQWAEEAGVDAADVRTAE